MWRISIYFLNIRLLLELQFGFFCLHSRLVNYFQTAPEIKTTNHCKMCFPLSIFKNIYFILISITNSGFIESLFTSADFSFWFIGAWGESGERTYKLQKIRSNSRCRRHFLCYFFMNWLMILASTLSGSLLTINIRMIM